MEIVKKIRLSDGSEHHSKEMATRHLYNLLSRDESLKFCESLANQSALKIKNYLIDNHNSLKNILRIIEELKEVDKLTNF